MSAPVAFACSRAVADVAAGRRPQPCTSHCGRIDLCGKSAGSELDRLRPKLEPLPAYEPGSGARPLCFVVTEDWLAWKQSARYAHKSASEFCEDCSPAHQADMVMRRKCQFPGTTFERGDDGVVRGIRPAAAEAQEDLFGDAAGAG